MDLPSIIILAAVCVLIGLALLFAVRGKKRGKGCGGDCSACKKGCFNEKEK